jgi:hypothetical protein
MYCSACGSAVAQSLSYCNRCGAKAGGAKGEGLVRPSELSLDSLVWATVSLFIAGLGVIIGLMAVMKEVVRFDPAVILGITALSFVLLLTVEAVLVRLLLSGWRRAKEAGAAGRPTEELTTRELGEARARVLPEPVPSVTEHTTRTFEPIYRERKSR